MLARQKKRGNYTIYALTVWDWKPALLRKKNKRNNKYNNSDTHVKKKQINKEIIHAQHARQKPHFRVKKKKNRNKKNNNARQRKKNNTNFEKQSNTCKVWEKTRTFINPHNQHTESTTIHTNNAILASHSPACPALLPYVSRSEWYPGGVSVSRFFKIKILKIWLDSTDGFCWF